MWHLGSIFRWNVLWERDWCPLVEDWGMAGASVKAYVKLKWQECVCFLVVLFCMFASISCLIKSSGDLCLEQPFKVPKAEFKKIKNNIDFQSRNQCPELNGLSPSNLWWFLSAALLIWLSYGGYWVTVRVMQKQMRTQLLASVKWKTTDCTLRSIYTEQLYQ